MHPDYGGDPDSSVRPGRVIGSLVGAWGQPHMFGSMADVLLMLCCNVLPCSCPGALLSDPTSTHSACLIHQPPEEQCTTLSASMGQYFQDSCVAPVPCRAWATTCQCTHLARTLYLAGAAEPLYHATCILLSRYHTYADIWSVVHTGLRLRITPSCQSHFGYHAVSAYKHQPSAATAWQHSQLCRTNMH